jgi:anti-sigma B factor antagonist
MEIRKVKEGSKLTVEVEGRLDTATAPQLEQALEGAYEGITELVFDFEKLAYISSTGLRILLLAEKTMKKQGSMVVRNVNEVIMDVFDATGFVDILTIE